MSYARFGRDGSDVYVFCSTEGLECCMCALVERWEVYPDNAAMVAHMEEHVAAGHTVPEYVFERLRDPADAAKNKAIWARYRK